MRRNVPTGMDFQLAGTRFRFGEFDRSIGVISRYSTRRPSCCRCNPHSSSMLCRMRSTVRLVAPDSLIRSEGETHSDSLCMMRMRRRASSPVGMLHQHREAGLRPDSHQGLHISGRCSVVTLYWLCTITPPIIQTGLICDLARVSQAALDLLTPQCHCQLVSCHGQSPRLCRLSWMYPSASFVHIQYDTRGVVCQEESGDGNEGP